MNRYIHKRGANYCYSNKNAFITDLCQELQKGRKEYAERKKKRGSANPLWLNKGFELIVGKRIEWWHFSIFISDVFEVEKCVADIGYPDGIKTITYCCNTAEAVTWYGATIDDPDNIFRNITEFREFITREVLKEDK